MKYATLSAVLLATLVAPPLQARQDMVKKAPKPATASAPAAAVKFDLPVTGLSVDNAAKVKASLAALSVKEYVCPDCGHAGARAGTCAECDVELELKTATVFKDVKTAADKGTIAFVVEPDARVRLSTIEESLRANSITVPRDEIQVAHGMLVYTGAAGSDDAVQLQKAFRDAKLATAEAVFEPSSKEIHVNLPEGSLTWARAAELGTKMTKPLRLNDIGWGGMHAPRG